MDDLKEIKRYNVYMCMLLWDKQSSIWNDNANTYAVRYEQFQYRMCVDVDVLFKIGESFHVGARMNIH